MPCSLSFWWNCLVAKRGAVGCNGQPNVHEFGFNPDGDRLGVNSRPRCRLHLLSARSSGGRDRDSGFTDLECVICHLAVDGVGLRPVGVQQVEFLAARRGVGGWWRCLPDGHVPPNVPDISSPRPLFGEHGHMYEQAGIGSAPAYAAAKLGRQKRRQQFLPLCVEGTGSALQTSRASSSSNQCCCSSASP